jgi:preprotein translocase subunit Sec61beta
LSTNPEEVRSPQSVPRAVAISGIVFAVLFIIGLVLIRLAVPADPNDPGDWLANAGIRSSVRTALNLIPFSGLAFLWFMAVLRNRIGLKEDRFFATVFLGSGMLFTGMLFVSAALASGLLDSFGDDRGYHVDRATYAFGRRVSYVLMNVYAIKMAAVFMFVTSSIGLRTAFLPRWLAYVGFAVGLVLLLEITEFAWIALVFPMWVLLVSAYVLIFSPPYEGGAGEVAGK